MESYEVQLKIKNKSDKGNFWTFKWEGYERRVWQEKINLYIEAETVEDLYEAIMELSENSLEIVSYDIGSKEERKHVETYYNLASNILSPKQIITITQSIPSGISNN